MRQPDELRTIQEVLAGQTERFRDLVEAHQAGIFRLLARLVPDRHAREDLAQDVFLTAFGRLASFDPERGAFTTWLYTIARNKSLNWLQRRRPWTSLPDTPDGQPAAERAVLEDELFQRLDQELARLPSNQKMAFVLAELEGLPYEQVAAIEQIPVGTVKSRVHRARLRLRAVMKPIVEHR